MHGARLWAGTCGLRLVLFPRRRSLSTGIFAGWVFTVIATGGVAAAIFSFAIFSPSKFAVPQDLSTCPGHQLFAYDQATGQFNGIACAGAAVS